MSPNDISSAYSRFSSVLVSNFQPNDEQCGIHSEKFILLVFFFSLTSFAFPRKNFFRFVCKQLYYELINVPLYV